MGTMRLVDGLARTGIPVHVWTSLMSEREWIEISERACTIRTITPIRTNL